jgi:hypothetical protein
MSPFLFRHAPAQPNQFLSSPSVSAAVLRRGILDGRLPLARGADSSDWFFSARWDEVVYGRFWRGPPFEIRNAFLSSALLSK